MAYKKGDRFHFRLNINHIIEGFRPELGFRENAITRMLMAGNFDYNFEHSYNVHEVGVWYDEETGRYFGFFYFDLECRMYRLRRTDEIEN